MISDYIKILTSSNTDYITDSPEDCACSPANISKHRTDSKIFSTHTTLGQPKTLYTQDIASEHIVALNLTEGNQVAVLNEPARALLDHFSSFQSVQSITKSFPAISPNMLYEKVERLFALSLLEPVNDTKEHIASKCTPRSEILTAWLHVTNQCNLRCPYCYIHKTSAKMALETGRQSIDAIIRSALRHGFKRVKLKYAGGEAMLNFPLIAAIQSYAEDRAVLHSLNLESVVLSNGVIVTDGMIDFLREHQIKLMISLDGIGATHDSQRPFINGRGSFKQVERSLDKLIEQKFLPDISITISNRNLFTLPETVAYVLERELPFSLNFYRDNECSAQTVDLRFANQRMIEAMVETFTVIEKHLPRQSLLNAIVDRANLHHFHTHTCGVGQNYLVIDQDGNVAKCHMEIEKPVTSIQADDPLTLINQDERGIQNLHVEEKEGCRECEWRYWCAGGCPLLTYRATGRYDVKSPNCDIYKAIFPAVLRLEGLRILKYYG